MTPAHDVVCPPGRGGVQDRPARVPAAVLWPLALMSFANLVLRSYVEIRGDVDFEALHDGAVRFVEGTSVYAELTFLLTPSGLLTVAPFGLLDADTGFLVWNTLSLVAAVVGLGCALRLLDIPLRGPVAAGALLAFALSDSLTTTLLYGNLNNTVLLALGAGFLLAEQRDRPVLAGVLLGLALAVKPVLVLLLVIPLLRRGWATLGWSLAIPAVLNLVGFLLTPRREEFLTITVPNLIDARPDRNISVWAVGTFLGVPEVVLSVLRVTILVITLAVVWRLRHLPDRAVRLGVTSGVLLLATFLGASLSQTYYSLLLIPMLLTVVRVQSPMHSWVAWLGMYLFATSDSWALPDQPGLTEAYNRSQGLVGWALVFGVVVVWALRRRNPQPDDTDDRRDRPPATSSRVLTPAATELPGT